MNVAVRTTVGVNGELVVLAAWCPKCEVEALPHDRDGTCLFCDTVIYRALAEREAERGTPTPASVATRPRSASVRTDLRLGRVPITDDDLIAALQHCAAMVGHSPTLREYDLHVSKPSHRTVWRRYGSWKAALTAAGLGEAA